MGCKECEFIKVYDFIFPDGTKTIECLKFTKHLGFTNKKGQVKKVNSVAECKLNCKVVEVEPIVNYDYEDTTSEVLRRGDNYVVEVFENNVKSVIFTSKYEREVKNKLEMFRMKKSWITGITYNRRHKRWVAKIYIGKQKYKQVGTFKSFMEAKRALKEAKIFI